MSEQPSQETPSDQQTPTQAVAVQRRSKAFTTFLLAATLSAVLIALLLAYLIFAPTPTPTASVPVPGVAGTAPLSTANMLRFVVPRSLITPDLLNDFQTESGVTVDLVPYDDDEALGADGANAVAGDVVLVSGNVIQKLNAQDRLSVLPARQISNLGLIDPSLRTLATSYDKGGLHTVPYVWTAYGLGLNRDAVTKQLGQGAAVDAWGAGV